MTGSRNTEPQIDALTVTGIPRKSIYHKKPGTPTDRPGRRARLAS